MSRACPATRALNVVAELPRDRVAEVRRRLQALQPDPRGSAVSPPADLPDTHFTRFVVIEDAPTFELPPLLVWESNHDRRAAAYLRRIAEAAQRSERVRELDPLWEYCAGYPGLRDAKAWVRWMRAHAVSTRAFYTAYRGVPKRQIDSDLRMRRELRELLDGRRDELAALAPAAAHAEIREHLRAARPPLDLAPGGGALARRLRFWAGRLQLAAVAAALLLLAPVTVLGYLALRRRERTDPTDELRYPVRAAPALIAAEDRGLQNQLTHVVDIKPGWLRRFLLRGVLWVIDTLAATEFVDGHLGGITSIHFARWLILEDRRGRGASRRDRLLFFSSYDFSWSSYLGEFIDRQPAGLTAVWSNTVGFPPTRNLVQGGARDEECFKNWTRKHQIPTDLWWSGVPKSSVDNLREDMWIRARVERAPTGEELPEWLRRL